MTLQPDPLETLLIHGADACRKVPTPGKRRVLMVFDRRSGITGALLRGIAKYQQLYGQWSVFIDDESGAECRSERLWDQNWDGVISAHSTPILVRSCLERNVPLVDLTDGRPFAGTVQVRPANLAVGHMGAEDLAERGYRHFGFCGFSNELWSVERREGFVEALALLGLGCTVLECESPRRYSPDWAASQLALITAWLKRQPAPLALMACHDLLAVQVLEAARACERSVPEEVAVLGVNDDRACCEMAQPFLSSVALDFCQAGYLAAESLAGLMQGEPVLCSRRYVEPLGVVTRQSTDMLAFGDRRVSAALRFIRDNACRGLTVEEVVRRVAVPRHHLERGMRLHIGRSPQAEIRRVQVAEIKRLLQQTDKPLKDIAECTGFEYVEYMCVLFKRLVGETPGRFRKNAGGRFSAIGKATGVSDGPESDGAGLASATA